jgi:type I restriction enzyme, S subunit
VSVHFSKLREQAEIIMGQSPPGDSYNSEGLGFPLLNGPTEFGVVHPTERQWTDSPTKLCEPGDILFCVRGATAGRTNVADKEYCLGRGLAAIRARSNRFDTRFLHYVLSAGYSRFQARGVGSTFINISADLLSDFDVPLMPLREQQRVATILDQVDDLRRKRRKALERLEALKRSTLEEIMRSVGAEAKSTRLGELVAEFRYGTSEKAKGQGYPVLRIPNVIGNTISIDDLKHVELEKNEVERLKLQEGDLLFVRTNGNREYVGRSAVVAVDLGEHVGLTPSDFVYASYLIRARLKADVVDPSYLQAFLSSTGGRKSILERAKTSAGQFNINIDGLSSIPVDLAPIDQQRRFTRSTDAVNGLMTHHRAHLTKLDALFASLQHRAFRGEL